MSAQVLDFSANREKSASHNGVTPALAAISQKGTMVIPELPESIRGCSANPSHLEEGLAVLTTETAPTAEPNADTNLLNLLIVDDERSVRESCREVGPHWDSIPRLRTRPNMPIASWIPQTWISFSSICVCREQTAWKCCARSSGDVQTPWW